MTLIDIENSLSSIALLNINLIENENVDMFTKESSLSSLDTPLDTSNCTIPWVY